MNTTGGDAMTDTFGDYTSDDAYDLEPADPEQVARKLHDLRWRNGWEQDRWDDLNPVDRSELVEIIVVVLAWLRRQGALR